MQKKIITSLLVSPLAFGAFANIDVTGPTNTKWTPTGMASGGDTNLFEASGSLVKGEVGLGSITQKVSVPCAGTYRVTFNVTGDTKLSIDVAGLDSYAQPVYDEEGEVVANTVEFYASGKGEVTFTVSSANAAMPFSFTSCSLEIVYDFDQQKKDMQALLDQVVEGEEIVNVGEKPSAEVAAIVKQLQADKDAVAKDKPEAQKLIDAIVPESASNEEKLACYEKYKLYDEYSNPIQVAIQELAEKSEDVNTKVMLFNANYTALTELTAGYDAVKKLQEAQATKITANAVNASVAADLDSEKQTAAAQFVAQSCSAYNTAAAADVAAYKKAIDAAYADLLAYVDDEVIESLANQKAALDKEVKELQDKVTAAYQSVTDYSAVYGESKGYLALLKAQLTDAQETILDLESIDENAYEGIYNKNRATWLASVNKDEETARTALKNTTLENATKSAAENAKTYTDNSGKISATVASAVKWVGDRNAAMTKLLATYKSYLATYNTTVTDLSAVELDDDQQELYDELQPAAEESIQAFYDAFVAGYKDTAIEKTFAEGNYAELQTAAETAVTNFNDMTKQFKTQMEVLDYLNTTLVKYLNDSETELSKIDGVEPDFLTKQFKENKETLLAAVKDVDENSKDGVIKAIDNVKGFAEQVVDALTTANTAITGFEAGINWLKTNCTTQNTIDGKKLDAYTTLQNEIKGFETTCNDWSKKYVAVTNAKTPQDCLTAANDLGTEFDGWEGDINSSFDAYISALTKGNWNIVNKAITDLKVVTDIEKNKTYTDAVTKFNAIDVDKALAGDKKEDILKACNAANAAISGIWDNPIKGMNANLVEHNKLVAEIDSQIKNELAALATYIDGYSSSDAYAYYQSLINGTPSIKAQFETLKSDLGKELTAFNIVGNQVLSQRLSALENMIKPTTGTVYVTIKDNEDYYKLQQAKSASVNDLITNLLAEVQSYEGSVEYAQNFIKQLVDLRKVALKNVDATALADYKAGKSYAENASVIAAYDAVSDNAQEVIDKFNSEDGWYAQVKAQNESLLNGTNATVSNWPELSDDMEETYIAAVNAYNGYSDLSNKGYTGRTDFKQALESNSAKIFDLYSAYQNLINTVNNTVAESTAKKIAITEDEFITLAIAPAEKLIAEMNTNADGIIAQFDAAGVAYYNYLLAQVNNKITDYTATLKAAPFNYSQAKVTELLKPYVDEKNNAVKAYNAVKYGKPNGTPSNVNNYEQGIGYQMNSIANTLDKANQIDKTINEQVIAVEWKPVYDLVMNGDTKNKVVGFAQLDAEFAKYANNADIKKTYDEQYAKYTQAKTGAQNLNNNIGNIENLLAETNGKSVIDAQKEALNTFLTNAKSYLKVVEDAYQLSKTETDNDAYKITADNQYKTLETYAQTLGGPANAGLSLTSAESAIQNFKNVLLDYKAGKKDLAAVNNAKTGAQTAISSALKTAMSDEATYLQSFLTLVKVAYNDASANYPQDENKFKEQYDQIIACQNQVSAFAEYMLLVDGKKVAPTVDTFLAYAEDLEKTLSSLIEYLQSMAPDQEQTMSDTLSALNTKYNQTESSVTTSLGNVDKIEFAPIVAEEYEEAFNEDKTTVILPVVANDPKPALKTKFTEIDTDVKAVKTAYDAVGSLVITQNPVYVNALKSLNDSITKYNNVVTATNTRGGFYKTSVTNINAAQAKLNNLKALLDQFNLDESQLPISYSVEAAGYQVDIWKAINDLNRAYNAQTLTSAWNNPQLGSNIDNKALNAYQDYARKVSAEAAAAIAAVDAVLNGDVKDMILLPGVSTSTIKIESAALTSRLKTEEQNVKNYNPAGYAKYDDGVKDINTIITALNKIIEDANALYGQLNDLTYELGDLNNDGEVTVADVQLMTNLILNGTTFEDLINEGKRSEAFAADIIGNEKINVADFTALVNIILDRQNKDKEDNNSSKKISRASFYGVMNSVVADGNVDIEMVAENNGVRTYAVSISNPEAFVAGQIDFRVESTSRILAVRGADRLNFHEVMTAELGGATRVLIASENNAEFAGTDGVTLYVDVDGHSGLGFENAIFADESAQAYTYEAQAPQTTGIDSIYEGAKAVKEAVYDAAGRVMKGVQRGINIIRNSNGTVTKEIRK